MGADMRKDFKRRERGEMHTEVAEKT